MSGLGVRFRVPQTRRALVERTRLQAQLDTIREFPPRLILIAAPAGFGKTTLLTQWLTQQTAQPVENGDTARDTPVVAWLPLEPDDADAVQLVIHLAAAVHHATIAAGDTGAAGTTTQAMLNTDRPASPVDALAALINDIDDIRARVILALDDYHLAASPDVDETIAFLLDNLPPRATLAITTRSDPALPLARLRSRGELLEIRAGDLRFTTGEADAFLRHVMGLHLDATQVAALGARTEGWAAGLQLAALSANAHTTPQAVGDFIDDFTGSNRFVLDYLLEEVLNSEDDDSRRFLLHTSVLDQLSGPLCNALTHTTDSQTTLESLENRNVFLTPLDDTRSWYRYHHLFADALRTRLHAEQPDAIAPLHRAAATWYASQGMLANAIHHARSADDPTLVAELVEADIPSLRQHRRDRTIIDRLVLVDDTRLRTRPLLAACQAWAHLASGNLDHVPGWLATADQASTSAPQPLAVALPDPVRRAHADEVRQVPATVAIYRAALAQAHGDTASTAVHAARAAKLAGPEEHLIHAAAVGFLGFTDWTRGDVVRARTRFEDTRRHLEAAGNVADALSTAVPVAAMTIAVGRPDQARVALRDSIAAAEAHASAHAGAVLACHADLHVGLADLLRELDDPASSVEQLDAADGLSDVASLPENRFRLYVVSSDLLAASGDFAAALTALDEADKRYLPGFYPEIQPMAARRARLHLRAGRLDDARAWADRTGVSLADDPSYRHEYEHLTLVRLHLAEGDASAAPCIGMLDRVLADARSSERGGSIVEALMLRAYAHDRAGDVHRAHDDLGAALTLGLPAGYRRLFLDEGEPARRLLSDALTDRELAGVHDVIRDMLGTPSTPPPVMPLQLAAEPLSARELDVLRLLDSALTGPEIARVLYISLNTFRTHTKRIFLKLDVKTRRAAVARAAELGL